METFSSPNRMVREYFDFLRRLTRRAQSAETDADERQDTAVCVVMAVTIIEIFLNLYIRIVIEESSFRRNREQILKDMKDRCSLDKKLKKWPHLVFGKKLNLKNGPGKEFMDLKELRNNLVHFQSSWDTLNFPAMVINGVANTTAYDSLKSGDAVKAVTIAEKMLAEIFRLRGMPEEEVPHALHLWAAKLPSNPSLNSTGVPLRSTPSG